MQFVMVITLVFAVFVAIFALQNAYPVTVHFLDWQFEASLALVILISALAGAVLFGISGLVRQARSRIHCWRWGTNGGEKKSTKMNEDDNSEEKELWVKKQGVNKAQPAGIESGRQEAALANGGEGGAEKNLEDKKG